jgi:hypothetical protein
MVAKISNRRGDGQLRSILHETANWTVNGRLGVVFCEVASLRLAIDRAVDFAAKGREVIALVRRRPVEIVVFYGQVKKLAAGLSEPEIYPILYAMPATLCHAGDFMPCRRRRGGNVVNRA